MVGGRSASVVLVGLLGGAVFVAAPPRPRLMVARVSVSQYGRSLQVRDTVSNRGQATVPPSTTGYYLAQVRIGGRPVARLRPGTSSAGSVTLRIPPSVKPGSYRLRACADDHYRIRPAHCRAARMHSGDQGDPPVQ